MRKIAIVGIAIALGVVCVCGSANVCSADPRYVTIGTGAVTGIYYPTGGAISTLVNKKSDHYNLKVIVESTEGSVFNVNAIMTGDLEFGIVQSGQTVSSLEGIEKLEEQGPAKEASRHMQFSPGDGDADRR